MFLQLEPTGSLSCPELVSTPAVRVGASIAATNVAMLGETAGSWAACSDGRKCSGPGTFQPMGGPLGASFGVGDKVHLQGDVTALCSYSLAHNASDGSSTSRFRSPPCFGWSCFANNRNPTTCTPTSGCLAALPAVSRDPVGPKEAKKMSLVTNVSLHYCRHLFRPLHAPNQQFESPDTRRRLCILC